MRYCSKCGIELKDGAVFCVRCGARFEGAPVQKPQAQNAFERRQVAQPASYKTSQTIKPLPSQNHASEFVRIPFSEALKIMQEKRKGIIVAMLALMVISIICFTAANVQKTYVDHPIQYQVTEDAAFLSTEFSISRFDKSGNLVWKSETGGDGKLYGMLDFDVGADGKIYAADTGNKRIVVFADNGEFLNGFGSDVLSDNFTIKLLRDGNIVAADTGKHDVKLFSGDGQFIETVGSKGREDGEFHFPNGVEQLPDGTVLIAETNNMRIQRYDAGLNELKTPAWRLDGEAANPPGMSHQVSKPITWQYKALPTRILADPGREKIYVAYADEFESPDGYVGVFDFEGNFLENRFLALPDGGHIDARKMKLTPDGLVSFSDIDECFVGVWNPDTNVVSAAEESGIIDAAAKLSGISRQNRLLYSVGMSSFKVCIIGLIALLGYTAFSWLRMGAGEYSSGADNGVTTAPRGVVPSILISLIFPGAGQIYTRHYAFGSALICGAAILLMPIYADHRNYYSIEGYLPYLFPTILISIRSTLLCMFAALYLLGIIHTSDVTGKP